MSNFWSALGQGLTQFGQQRQQRQMQEQDIAREQQRYDQLQRERDRSYAWDVAQNLAPDQELDDASFGALSKAGPELQAYIQRDPLTGKRKWAGTQQQRTGAAREKAALEAAERNNALVAKQQEELARRDAATNALKDFTAKNGRHPTRDELFRIMTETGSMDPKMLGDWHLEDARIKSQEAMQRRYLAAAGRDDRYTPAGPRQPQPLDLVGLRNEARKKFAQGTMTQDEYNVITRELNRVEGLQKNPLQFYMNDVQNDLTQFYNSGIKPQGQPDAAWDPDPIKNQIRRPEVAERYLQYIQSDPDWQMQAEQDLRDPQAIQRYIGFVQQLQKKWQDEQAAQQNQGSWFGRFFGG